MNSQLEIYDGSGFLGIINTELYNTFVDEDWELEELLDRFRTETNNKHCVVWNTGTQNLMYIRIQQMGCLLLNWTIMQNMMLLLIMF